VTTLIEEIRNKGFGIVASAQAIVEAEEAIGYLFPEHLKAIYQNVSNGGVGPGYQILGVKGGHQSDEGDTISELYLSLKENDPLDPLWVWPEGLVPFCHWGCAIYSCFEATKPGNPIVWFDPNNREMGEPMEQQFIHHRESLESWLQGWVNGEDLWAETYGT